MKNILITGGSGLLGSNLSFIYRNEFNVLSIYNKNQLSMKGVNYLPCDLSKNEEVKKLNQFKPDIIIHCAALTNIDICESNKEIAFKHNVISTKNIAKLSKETGSYLIYISTDSVFNGKKGNYSEDSEISPLNYYGKTKYLGEQEVKNNCPKYSIIRTNIFGWNKRNKYCMAEWMLDKLRNHEILEGFKDVYFSPILVNDLSILIKDIIKIRYNGVIHLGSRDHCSKFEFAKMLSEQFNCDESLILPINLEEKNLKARRGKKLWLNVNKIEAILKKKLPTIKDCIIKYKELDNNNYRNDLIES
jgi:dTDP-4-dehydrorhamnose reductase